MVGRQDQEHQLSLEHAATGLRGAGLAVAAEMLAGDPDEVISAEVVQREVGLLAPPRPRCVWRARNDADYSSANRVSSGQQEVPAFEPTL